MMAVKYFVGWLILIFSVQATAQFVELEDAPRTAAEVKSANSVRDSTTAPNSWVGGAAQNMAKIMAESAGKPHNVCFQIKGDAWKYHCLANFDGRNGCFSIKDNDLKNHCLAQSEGRNGCFQVKNENLKNHCLGRFEGRGSCFMVKNDDLKNHCLARTEGKNMCYLIKNSDMKNHCLAVQ